jgi:hypothetical protein
MVDELRRWGFDRPRDELPGAGRVLKTEGTERELASLGVGLDLTEITPLHAALLGSVLASGEMAEPALLSGRRRRARRLAASRRPPRAPPHPRAGLGSAPAARAGRRRGRRRHRARSGAGDLPGRDEDGNGQHSRPGLPRQLRRGRAAPHPKIAFAVRITNQPTSHRGARRGPGRSWPTCWRRWGSGPGESAAPAVSY